MVFQHASFSQTETVGAYLKLLKLRIVLLNVLVAATSMIMASAANIPTVTFMLTLLLGGLAVAGAGAINNYLDDDIDSRMIRTRSRPLASGRILPPEKALFMGVLFVAVALAGALYLVNPLTAAFMALGIFFYLVVYTLWLKRRSMYNIVVGGVAGSTAALAGWAAVTNSIGLPAVLLAILVFLWTPGHFWPLAMRFRHDYEKAGIPMLPVVVNAARASRFIAASNFLTVSFSFTFFFLGEAGFIFLALALILGALTLARNVSLVKHSGENEARRVFGISVPYLLLILVALTASTSMERIMWPA